MGIATEKKAPVNLNLLLNQINSIREALAIGEGKLDELPKGEPGAAHHCVIAKALSNGWEAEVSDYIVLLHENRDDAIDFKALAKALRKRGFKVEDVGWDFIKISPTKTMDNFIERFDSGDFPNLILNG
jgi:hypothetical protein